MTNEERQGYFMDVDLAIQKIAPPKGVEGLDATTTTVLVHRDDEVLYHRVLLDLSKETIADINLSREIINHRISNPPEWLLSEKRKMQGLLYDVSPLTTFVAYVLYTNGTTAIRISTMRLPMHWSGHAMVDIEVNQCWLHEKASQQHSIELLARLIKQNVIAII